MPGTTDPPNDRPAPKKVLFSNSAFSFMNCSDTLSIGKPIWDYYTLLGYDPTPDGTYELDNELQEIEVENGFITAINEV